MYLLCISALLLTPCSGELRTQKLKSHLLRIQSLKVLPLKPGVGQYIATYAMLTARDFFLANFYHSGPFACFYFPQKQQQQQQNNNNNKQTNRQKTFSRAFPVLAVANSDSLQTTDAGSRVECPRNRNRLQNMCYSFCALVFQNCRCKLSCGLRKRDL